MDDLEIKLTQRLKGNPSNKSMMYNTLYSSKSITFNSDRENINDISTFDIELINSNNGIQSFIQLFKNNLTFNNSFIFTNAINLLEQHAISKKKHITSYNTNTQIWYELPVIQQLSLDFWNNETPSSFIINRKKYNTSNIYHHYGHKLHTLCPIILPEPTLPDNIYEIEVCKNNNQLHHSYNYDFKYFSTNLSNLDYQKQHHLQKTIIKQQCDPIHIKIKQKNGCQVTHIGILGCKPSVIQYKHNKYNDSIYTFDNYSTISYVTQFSLYFKCAITKKWTFLKQIHTNLNGIQSTYNEDIIPLLNGTEGIHLTELKIIPTEYVNEPSIRIACYGYTQKHITPIKETVTYIIEQTSNKNNKIIKRGKHWNWNWNKKHNKHREKNNILSYINEELNDLHHCEN